MADFRHKAFLTFINKVGSITSAYSKQDLREFIEVALRETPIFVSLIHEYLMLAEKTSTDAKIPMVKDAYRKMNEDETHLFDLLRSRKLFSSNLDLAELATRILPGFTQRRFDKMSRGDIASRIIEYLETLEPGTKKRLEESMKNALTETPGRKRDRSSFFSEWENIIKGTQL